MNGFRIEYAEIVLKVEQGTSSWTFRTPVHAESSVRVDSRSSRPKTKDDELAAAMSLQRYFTEVEGADYAIQIVESTSEYVDAFLDSPSGKPKLQLQIRHLDGALVKKLRQGQLSRILINALPSKVQLAIDHKQQVDTSIKNKTCLVLYCAVPIDVASKAKLMAGRYDPRGFQSVFVAVYRDRAFRLWPKGGARLT